MIPDERLAEIEIAIENDWFNDTDEPVNISDMELLQIVQQAKQAAAWNRHSKDAWAHAKLIANNYTMYTNAHEITLEGIHNARTRSLTLNGLVEPVSTQGENDG